MARNSIRTKRSIASSASRAMRHNKSKAIRKIAASVLVNRKRKSK